MSAERQLKKNPIVSAQELAACYRLWLGVPEHEFPPPAHRLLGISENETDREVVRDGLIRQERHVKTFINTDRKLAAKRVLKNLQKAEQALLNRLASRQPEQRVQKPKKRRAKRWPWFEKLLKTATLQLLVAMFALAWVGMIKYLMVPASGSNQKVKAVVSRPPEFARYPLISIEAGEELRISPFVVDPAGPREQLEYRLIDTVPNNAAINRKTGLISWATDKTPNRQRQKIQCSVTQTATGLSTDVQLRILLLPKSLSSKTRSD